MTSSTKAKPAPKPRETLDLLRLPPPLRSLTQNQAVAREMLGRALHNLYGDANGMTAIGRRMAAFAGRAVSQPLVAHFLVGRYPMLPWAIDALEAVWVQGERELFERFQNMHVGRPRIRRVAGLARDGQR